MADPKKKMKCGEVKSNCKYAFYKTTCMNNGKFYFGVHACDKWKNRYYIGCGVASYGTAKRLLKNGVKSAFVRAVAKHGYKSFRKVIIRTFDSLEEAYKCEEAVVTRKLISSKQCYNCKLGGGTAISDNAKRKTIVLDLESSRIVEFDSMRSLSRVCGKKIHKKTLQMDVICERYVPVGKIKPVKLFHKESGWHWFANQRVAAQFIQKVSGSHSLETGRIREVLRGNRKHVRGFFASEETARLPHNGDGCTAASKCVKVLADGVTYKSARHAAIQLFGSPNLAQGIRYNMRRGRPYRGVSFVLAS